MTGSFGKTAACLMLFLLAATLPAARGTAAPGPGPARSEASVPRVWKDFTLPDANGGQVSLRQFIGKKPVLLIFWATWCPHCRESVPAVNRMHGNASANGGVQILALDYKESRQKVNAFIKEKKVAFPVLLDSSGTIARAYEVVGIPTYVLIDRSGDVVYRGHEIPETARYLR